MQVRLRGDLPGPYLPGPHFGSAPAWLRARYAAPPLDVQPEPGAAGSSRTRRPRRHGLWRPGGSPAPLELPLHCSNTHA